MPVFLAESIVVAVTAYILLGLSFAVPFLLRGLGQVDPHSAGSRVAVRLVLLPGTIAFWPLLLNRWARGIPVPVERTAHRNGAAGVSPG